MSPEKVAFYSMLASSASAIAAAVAAFFSFLAVNSWKNQEKLKAKQEFKRAVTEYLDVTRTLPYRAFPQDRQNQKEDFIAFKQARSACVKAWIIAEGQIKNADVKEWWDQLNNAHYDYLAIRKSINDVQELAHNIIESKFIF
ncbi:hypothetical protein DC438_05335 [Cronobacter sakazakii]|nr:MULTISPECIES: hypothetical protein [Enterobacteriaceae]AZP32583.1 hypothetical protein DC438_05335 [Cronobacter sakazakii]QBF86553.1 hypothetical protein EXN74_08595 [Leclercia adecarboxylata]